MLLDRLFERRLVLLSGKGGVGKSVVGRALALAARDRGLRAVLVEVDAAVEDRADAAGERVNLNPQAVMDEYVRRHVRIELIVKRILKSPVYSRFFAAAPGLKELMLLGKLVVLAEERQGLSRRPRYDVVIADLPATGHGLSLLRVPVSASAAIPVGPVGSQARWILEYVRDQAKTALVIVAIPEEMAVIEAIEFWRSAATEVGVAPAATVLNACHEPRFDADEVTEILRPRKAELSVALRAARRHLRLVRLTRFHSARLTRALAATPVALPFLYDDPASPRFLRTLADRLEQS